MQTLAPPLYQRPPQQQTPNQIGYANVLDAFGLGGLVGERGIQANANVDVNVRVEPRFWVSLVASLVIIFIAFFGVRKILL